MRECRNCGFTTEEELKFCPECGNALQEKKETITCPKCKFEIPGKTVKFCPNCGEKLESIPLPDMSICKEYTMEECLEQIDGMFRGTFEEIEQAALKEEEEQYRARALEEKETETRKEKELEERVRAIVKEAIDGLRKELTESVRALKEKEEESRAWISEAKKAEERKEKAFKERVQAIIGETVSGLRDEMTESIGALKGEIQKNREQEVAENSKALELLQWQLEQEVECLKESTEEVIKDAKRRRSAEFAVGMTPKFGTYESKSLEWLVLEAKGDERVMISLQGIANMPFNRGRSGGNKWETSDIRKWLNETFYDEVFCTAEKEMLADGVERDKVYLLSEEEAKRYFPDAGARVCYMEGRRCLWWLRSKVEKYGDSVSIVDMSGDTYGADVTASLTVRPVICVRI